MKQLNKLFAIVVLLSLLICIYPLSAPTRIAKAVGDEGGWLEFYDGKTWKRVELNFFIRIEDERHEEGLIIADWIEKYWKIKVNRFECDRSVCIPVVYGTDPLAYQWDLYTAGWVSMTEWPYPGDDLMWYYWLCPFLGYPYGAVNSSVFDIGYRLYTGAYANRTEYDALCTQLCRYGIWEGYRVFTAECWEYFAVNKERVNNIAYGRISGLWNPWPLRTANTTDGIMRVAEYSAMGSLFMSAWNPVLGFVCVYSEVMWRYLHDYGLMTDPEAGYYIPFRVTYSLKTGNVSVPTDAIIYNHTLHKWVTVSSGQYALVNITVNYKFSNWHHGIPMDISDVIATIGFYWEWAYQDEGEDVNYFYHPDIDYYYADIFQLIKGIRIINDTAMEIYGDYLSTIDDRLTASFYVWWPVIPWEVRTTMEYCVIYGGPSTGKTYGWSEEYATYGRDEWIDMINPLHNRDFEEVITKIDTNRPLGWFRSNYTVLDGTPYAAYTPTDAECHDRWSALSDWQGHHGHICVSNGPFYLDIWDPVRRYLVMKAFRDPTYPFTADYWVKYLKDHYPDYIANPGALPSAKPGPSLKEIIWTVEMSQETGLKKAVEGDIDIFMWSMPWTVYEGLSEEDLAKILTIACRTGIWCIEMNWAGCTEPTVGYMLNETAYPGIVEVTGGEGEPYREDGTYFNPFALREIRYALNWLINRAKLVELALHGSGLPMFSAIQPSHPANSTFWPIYEEYGLTAEGDPAKSAEMVKKALEDIMHTWKEMGAPYKLRGGLLAAPPPPPPPRPIGIWIGVGVGIAVVVIAAAAAIILRRKA